MSVTLNRVLKWNEKSRHQLDAQRSISSCTILQSMMLSLSCYLVHFLSLSLFLSHTHPHPHTRSDWKSCHELCIHLVTMTSYFTLPTKYKICTLHLYNAKEFETVPSSVPEFTKWRLTQNRFLCKHVQARYVILILLLGKVDALFQYIYAPDFIMLKMH